VIGAVGGNPSREAVTHKVTSLPGWRISLVLSLVFVSRISGRFGVVPRGRPGRSKRRKGLSLLAILRVIGVGFVERAAGIEPA
jgi:hypothetical protein